MAGFSVPIKDAQVTLIDAASTLSNDTMTGETITEVTSTKTYVDLVLTTTFTVAPSIGSTISVFRRDMGIDGANNAPVPVTDDYEHHYVGSFTVDDVSASQSLPLNGVYKPHNCEFYILNRTGQEMGSGYTLKGTAWSWGDDPA